MALEATEQQKKEMEGQKKDQQKKELDQQKAPDKKEPEKAQEQSAPQANPPKKKRQLSMPQKTAPQKGMAEGFTPTGGEDLAAAPPAGAARRAPMPQQMAPQQMGNFTWSMDQQINKIAQAIYQAIYQAQRGMMYNAYISPYQGMPSPQQMRQQMGPQQMRQPMGPQMMGPRPMGPQMAPRPMTYGMPQQQQMWQSMAQNLNNYAQMSRTPAAKAAGVPTPQLAPPTKQQASLMQQLEGIVDYMMNSVVKWLDSLFDLKFLQGPDKPKEPTVDARKMGGLVNQNMVKQTEHRNQLDQQMKTCAMVAANKNIPPKDRQQIVSQMTGKNPEKPMNEKEIQGAIKQQAEKVNAKLEKASPEQLKQTVQEMDQAKKTAVETLVSKDPKTAAKIVQAPSAQNEIAKDISAEMASKGIDPKKAINMPDPPKQQKEAPAQEKSKEEVSKKKSKEEFKKERVQQAKEKEGPAMEGGQMAMGPNQ